MVHDPGN